MLKLAVAASKQIRIGVQAVPDGVGCLRSASIGHAATQASLLAVLSPEARGSGRSEVATMFSK